MNTLKQIILLIILNAIAIFSNAQGIIRGQIIDDATGETMISATVMTKETSEGTVTDLDGNFELKLTPGKYTILISYTGFQDLIINDVIIVENKVEVINVRMKESSQMIKEVVVTATQIRNTESAIATIKQKAPNLLDGISSQTIKRNGDGNAGEALRRVTGVSVEGGKHVVVRGLGDRYTKIILNSSEIPGLDPDKNSVQMDIFPTNLVDNILVYKTFSPDLPGDFTGGAIDIITKDFPDTKTVNASIILGYNADMHFRDDFLNYKGGKTDFLGFDDGTRALPFHKKILLPDPSLKNPALSQATSLFDKTLAPQKSRNDLNKALSFSIGDQKKIGEGSIGYTFGLNYTHGYQHYNDYQFGEYYKNASNNEYFVSRQTMGTLSETNVLWSAIGGLSYKNAKNKIKLEALHIQNADTKSAVLNAANLEFNSSVILKNNLEYTQRQITNVSLTGKHNLSEVFTIDWRLSPTIVNVSEPDIRTTGFDITDESNPVIRPAVGADVTRIFRNLNEVNYNGRVDVVYNLKINDKESKIKAGIYNTIKEREFEIYNFVLRVNNQFDIKHAGNPNNLLTDGNLWNPENNTGTYVVGNYEPANTFKAKQNIMALYLMNELPISNKLKLNYGVRYESAQTLYNGQNNQGNIIFINKEVFKSNNLLPSINMIYELLPKVNIRTSYNMTVARPTFKENSIAQIQDRITDRTFLGNIDLKQTSIHNYDLRFEKYFDQGGLMSLSGFYKKFINPIQLTVYDASNPTNFIPRNFEDTNVFGVEAELNRKLNVISESLKNFNASVNYTHVLTKASLVGLSPSILNAALSYINVDNGIEFTASYNVQSKRLSIIGIDRIENISELPFKSLNARLAKSFGKNKMYSLSLLAENILNSNKTRAYDTKDNSSAIFDIFKPGRQYSVTFNYTLK